MSWVKKWTDLPADQRCFVAVAVSMIAPDHFHCGVLHCDDGEALKLLHLHWHCDVREEAATAMTHPAFFVVPDLPDERRALVAARCRKVFRRSAKSIAYALSYRGGSFSEDGDPVLVGDECGFTCATFVVAVFAGAEVRLVNVDDWHPQPEDAAWQEQVISLMSEKKVPRSHIDAVKKQAGCSRVRPCDVGAAASFTPVTAPQEKIRTRAHAVFSAFRSS